LLAVLRKSKRAFGMDEEDTTRRLDGRERRWTRRGRENEDGPGPWARFAAGRREGGLRLCPSQGGACDIVSRQSESLSVSLSEGRDALMSTVCVCMSMSMSIQAEL
jgi:hypothetical protein